MRLTSAFILPALCWRLACAAEQAARVYIYDPLSSQEPRESRTLSPTAARLVLAQRIGVEDFHSADLGDKDVVEAINEYGIKAPLFADQSSEGTGRVMLYTEEEKDMQYLSKTFSTSFTISNEPSSQSAKELWDDLKTQELAAGPQIQSFGWLVGPANIESAVKHMKERGDSITILYLPSTPVAYGAGDEWGTYRMPSTASLLKKREEPQEEPLEQAPESKPESTITPMANQTEPFKGIVPACYPDEASCQKNTRNCTGHGACSLKYKDASTDPPKSCYSCECQATVSKDSDGRISTTYWGGPACQKKDVSVQFWLIALFSVAMVGLISFAVGQVWSMGDEPLPSVIGAGVTGPTARK